MLSASNAARPETLRRGSEDVHKSSARDRFLFRGTAVSAYFVYQRSNGLDGCAGQDAVAEVEDVARRNAERVEYAARGFTHARGR